MRRDGPLFHESVLMSPFHPLTGSLSQKSDKKSVYQVWLSMALWPKTCPWDLPTQIRRKKFTVTYYVKVKLLLLVEVNFMKLFSGMIR